MPVKAKRSTYNYSLPITVKKMRECLCSPVARGWFALTLRDTEEDGPLGQWGRGPKGLPQAAADQRAREGRGETSPLFPSTAAVPSQPARSSPCMT